MAPPRGSTTTRVERRGTVRRAADWWGTAYLVSGVLAAAGVVFAMKLWRADWTVPFFDRNDALAVAAHFKTVSETGWYESQPLLGAPFGQQYHDFPTADNLQFMAARVLSAVLGDWAAALNVWYVLGFVLVALTATFFFLRIGMSRILSVVLSVLFALAPYHFIRNENHLALSSYFTLPLAFWVVHLIATGQPLWLRRAGVRNPVLAVLTGRGAAVAASSALVVTGATYYGFFTVVFIALVGVASWWRLRDWRRLGGAVVAGLVVVLTAVLNMLPDVLWSWRNGSDGGALVRTPVETEYYSLKLTQLLLPMPGHRVQLLSNLREYYDDYFPYRSETPVLGAVAAAGFVLLVVVAVSTLLGRRRPAAGSTPANAERFRTVRLMAGLALVAFLFGTLGGLSSLFSFVTSSLRGANRMSIVIALLSLAGLGLALDAAVARVVTWRPHLHLAPTTATLAVGAVLLAGGTWDQTSAELVPDYSELDATWAARSSFFSQVQTEVGDGAQVLQLPYSDFPEASASTGHDFESGLDYAEVLIPYLHTTTVRWSAGGIKGRTAAEWPAAAQDYDAASIADQVAVLGFDGVLVDRDGTVDRGAELESGLDGALGAPSLTSDDGRWVLYTVPQELRDAAAALPRAELDELRDAIRQPLVATPGSTDPTVGGDNTVNSVDVQNDREDAVAGSLRLELTTLPGVDAVVVTTPDGTRTVVPVSDASVDVDLPAAFAPGTTHVTVEGSTDGGATTTATSLSVGIDHAAVLQDDVERLDLTP
ncbi:hypothetical protein ES689_02095 [Frigoribacterium sp. ACAM 257]|uniref:hypothetical protein n=1 Tax=Frigoribacterium sp. ACAM 257 TaxID=2508998 RepID=UPI0011BA3B2B|nr:hypothetical protein [Frigoribacterium sp. ACAM 257]TWX40280.1 hypothetical protein ES689_02095 [Frigoribacterium sp. ACAM 257]